jgi:hypothetical protein
MSLRPRVTPSTLYRLAMLCILISTLLAMLAHPASVPATDRLDGIRGLLLGLALGLIYLFFRAKRTRSR